jgi:hypothetical protein
MLSVDRSGELCYLMEVTQEYVIYLLAIQEVRCLGKSILEIRIMWCMTAVIINNTVLEWVSLSVIV